MNGIAHITYPGGGIVMPARSAYERQLVSEHVTHRALRSTVVRLDVGGRRWQVAADAAADRPQCGKCLRRVRVSGTNASVAPDAYCLVCLLDLAPPRKRRRRSVAVWRAVRPNLHLASDIGVSPRRTGIGI